MRIKRALLSVYDKSQIIELAVFLAKQNVEIIATGNTYKVLENAGIEVIELADYTGYPEIMDGRVKTLHPKIHGGILNNRSNHASDMAGLGILDIDLVVVNLYPFRQTAERLDSTKEQIIEQIDIGGVALLRAAAKNHQFVTVISEPSVYRQFIEHLQTNNNEVDLQYKRELAAQAFACTAQYDASIYNWLLGNNDVSLPSHYFVCGQKVQDLRCGENPQQRSSFYSTCGLLKYPFEQLSGKELSYNNIVDIEAAFAITEEFSEPVAVIVKHNNPCGVAIASDVMSAYTKALSCDPQSSFGGIVAVNREVNESLARELNNTFLEVIVAPKINIEALAVLKEKKNLRIVLSNYSENKKYETKSVAGGFLLQNVNQAEIESKDFVLMTKRIPTTLENEDMLFAWKVCKYVKSNAIVIAKGGKTVGIGAGQMSRVDSIKIALNKALEHNHDLKGAVLASDAFFPFADSIELSARAGVIAIVQTGGSIRDQDVIQAADKHGISMSFTGVRNFYH